MEQKKGEEDSVVGEAMSKRPMVLVTSRISDYIEGALEERFTVYKLWEAVDQEAFVKDHALDIRALVVTPSVGASASLILALPRLEIVSSFSVGLDKVDLPLCRKRGVRVTNTPDVLTDCTADLAVLLMLASMRRLCAAERFVRHGLWSASSAAFPLAHKASGKRVGIVGLGRIGKAIATRVEAFGCTVSYQGRSSKGDVPYTYYSSVVDMASNIDVLIISCPLTEETYHMVNKEVIESLGPHGTLVNIARGPIIDEPELVKALVEGRLGAAGLDVFENEPCVPAELLNMDNVVLAPHIGSATWETRMAMADLVVGNLEAHFSGKPLLTPVD